MQPLIYYPTFEPPRNIWLKFAIIYFEEFRPIIPVNREHLVSGDFKRIIGETDLINPINPSYQHGELATEKAIAEIERFFDYPYRHSPLFNQLNVINRWRDQSKWTFEIYQDKFSQEWTQYCLSHNIGEVTANGILVSEELGFVFMSYLANEMAYTENTAIITDNSRFDKFTNARRLNEIAINRRNKFAKGMIDLKIPKGLSEISIPTLIKFRNKNRKKINAFNIELDKIQSSIGSGITERDFIESYNGVYTELNGIIAGLGVGLASLALQAYILVNQDISPDFNEYLAPSLEAIGIAITGHYSLKKALADSKNQRYCKKYFLRLGEL